MLVAEEVAAQVLDVLEGRSARYAVNAPLVTPETARAIGPYLPLAEILGRFFAQFSPGGVRTLTLEIAGELAEHDASPLTAAVLRGLLETVTTERVNLVNAGALAKSRGISLVERKTRDAGAYAAQLHPFERRRTGRPRHHGRWNRGGRRGAHHPPWRVPARHGADR